MGTQAARVPGCEWGPKHYPIADGPSLSPRALKLQGPHLGLQGGCVWGGRGGEGWAEKPGSSG